MANKFDGEMAERLKAAVLKIAGRANAPQVQILLSPPQKEQYPLCFGIGLKSVLLDGRHAKGD